MKDKSIMQVRLESDGRVIQVLPDGSTGSLKDETDLERLKATTDEDIKQQIATDPDVAPILDDDFWSHATLVFPSDDQDIVHWYKETYGPKYRAEMNMVLRKHMESPISS
ncbi:MAG: hypothetical protein ACI8V2_000411 [Candidatus Latescibacterota bacterium]